VPEELLSPMSNRRWNPRRHAAIAARPRRPLLESMEQRVLLSDFTVTNTNDDLNQGSLRWAITQSNGQSGTNLILFNVPGAGGSRALVH
jgi:hypothetical protein